MLSVNPFASLPDPVMFIMYLSNEWWMALTTIRCITREQVMSLQIVYKPQYSTVLQACWWCILRWPGGFKTYLVYVGRHLEERFCPLARLRIEILGSVENLFSPCSKLLHCAFSLTQWFRHHLIVNRGVFFASKNFTVQYKESALCCRRRVPRLELLAGLTRD